MRDLIIPLRVFYYFKPKKQLPTGLIPCVTFTRKSIRTYKHGKKEKKKTIFEPACEKYGIESCRRLKQKNAGIMSIFRNIEIRLRMHFQMPLNWIAEQCSTSCLPILR